MSRNLFFGVGAVDSILPLVKVTNARLMGNHSTYSPWMAIPEGMLERPLSKDWLPQSRFFQPDERQTIQDTLACIRGESDNIPSFEKYDLKIAELSVEEADQFNNRMVEAENHLCSIAPVFKSLIDALVVKYIPTTTTQNTEIDHGMSTLWLKGAIFFEKSQRVSLDQRAENLAHEIAHQIMIHYQLNDPLIEGDLNLKVYSGIRGEPRPAILSFHGAAALCYMLWIRPSNSIKTMLASTLSDLSKVQFTAIGAKIFDEFHESLNVNH